MQMIDSSLGPWTVLLIGHQWPGSESLAAMAAAAATRKTSSGALERYADSLRSVITGPLADQEGLTAEDARDAFSAGERHALALAEKNLTKGNSYESANRYVSEFRSELAEIAADGDAQIKQVLNSGDPAPIKFNKLVEIVVEAQSRANAKAAAYSDNLFAAVQKVLDHEGIPTSAREFAKANGFDADNAQIHPNKDAIRDHVAALTNIKDPAPKTPPTSSQPAGHEAGSLQAVGQQSEANPGQGSVDMRPAGSGALHTVASKSAATPTPSNSSIKGQPPPSSLSAAAEAALPSAGGGSAVGTAPTQGSAVGGTSTLGTTGLDQSAPTVVAHQTGLPSTPTPSLPTTPTNALSPEGFAQNFNAGTQAGNPMSAGSEALSNSAAHAMQPQTPIHPETMAAPPLASTTPSAGAPLFENAHAASAFDAPPPAAPPADGTQTYMAAPAAPAAPVMSSTAAPAAPQGPLPAYGADLRPPAATAPASPPPGPLAASPASAPVHPSNASPLSQPAVVRQQPIAPAATTHTPTGIAENAVAATGSGAISGAAAAQIRAQQRLQRLVDAVAHQEPKLSWAVGDRDDATTVLTTDLASGWIPPHIEIPTGIKLLAPGRRSRTLEALLGETTLTAAYTPGQYIPPAEDTEPVSMSIRARDTDDVDELGWELSQATKWRDGLPRLAHTLAKAVSTRTGYLDSEVDLLREHLDAVAERVIADYPDADIIDIGHWQLLATIDALIKDEKTAANYHFAWFQALSLVSKGDERR